MNQMANEIKDNFIKGYDCSQVVFRHFAERFDLSEDEANRIAACFGGLWCLYRSADGDRYEVWTHKRRRTDGPEECHDRKIHGV